MNCQISGNLGGFYENEAKGVSQSLVLDSEKGELVKASGRVGKKTGKSEGKSIAALKSHSEAERRRRERINAHLATLRNLVPSSDKMDKAALLAEVICQVKQLKETATHVSESFFIPLDSDEIRVETIAENAGDGTCLFRASICCEYRPELLSDLREVINSLHVNLVKSEISTLGSRVKNIFVFTNVIDGGYANIEVREILLTSARQAFSSVLDKVSAFPEYSTYPNKRQRISCFDTSSLL
ncbi:PREDICTED: transcription factor bHLH30-like [Nicotiana attenuata]|uniref:Transcription factor bhlh30 n=1 Tax=Nicotiana attenuata TaxID=49451 RepID=A0A1J6JRP8_NICAT|nr:PREDICTED: transcription factor bHLH30-like [Nicotiana attenuata]OIT19870.1 transcription factor bhlh30 [Nicotiana attenuata]